VHRYRDTVLEPLRKLQLAECREKAIPCSVHDIYDGTAEQRAAPGIGEGTTVLDWLSDAGPSVHGIFTTSSYVHEGFNTQIDPIRLDAGVIDHNTRSLDLRGFTPDSTIFFEIACNSSAE